MANTLAVPPINVTELERAMTDLAENEVKATPAANALKEFVDVEQLKRDVEFNPNDLDNAVSTHASMFVHYANQARLAQRQHEKMKNAFAILESRLGQHHRDILIADAVGTSKKPTEAQIKEAVMTDPRWWQGANRLSDAQAIWSLARDAKSAFEQRKDMIVQISVDRRIERQGQLRIMEAKDQAGKVQSNRAAAVAAAGGNH